MCRKILVSTWQDTFVSAIMDKSSWDTLRKRPVLLNEWVFESPIFTFQPPFQCCHHVTVSTERIATLKRRKGGFSCRQKILLKLRKEADRKRLFCSNVSALSSLIEERFSYKSVKAYTTISKGIMGNPSQRLLDWSLNIMTEGNNTNTSIYAFPS